MEKTKAKKTWASDDSQFTRIIELAYYIAKNGSRAQKDKLEKFISSKVMEWAGVQL
jgi:hypothetical protein